MYTNLLAKIEAEINETVKQQQQNPHDISIATKKIKLRQLAQEYILLEGKFKELAGLNSVY